MVAWSDYKNAATERGSLAYELFVALSSPALSVDEVKKQLPAHLEYQATLEQSGALAFAGPLSDHTGEQMEGMGMIVYRAESMELAKTLADADPMHSSGARSYTLRRWMINEGSFQLDVKLSAQTVNFKR
ncbi:MAG: hypothetical protein ACI9UN_002609 [Granulosicoccus sp.]|jgi:uncharacterized protein YciI